MDGCLEIDSDTGKGFCIRCTIPAERCQADTAPMPAEAVQDEADNLIIAGRQSDLNTAAPPADVAEAPASINDYFVLIVEDNPVNQMVIEGMLKNWNCPTKQLQMAPKHGPYIGSTKGNLPAF